MKWSRFFEQELDSLTFANLQEPDGDGLDSVSVLPTHRLCFKVTEIGAPRVVAHEITVFCRNVVAAIAVALPSYEVPNVDSSISKWCTIDLSPDEAIDVCRSFAGHYKRIRPHWNPSTPADALGVTWVLRLDPIQAVRKVRYRCHSIVGCDAAVFEERHHGKMRWRDIGRSFERRSDVDMKLILHTWHALVRMIERVNPQRISGFEFELNPRLTITDKTRDGGEPFAPRADSQCVRGAVDTQLSVLVSGMPHGAFHEFFPMNPVWPIQSRIPGIVPSNDYDFGVSSWLSVRTTHGNEKLLSRFIRLFSECFAAERLGFDRGAGRIRNCARV